MAKSRRVKKAVAAVAKAVKKADTFTATAKKMKAKELAKAKGKETAMLTKLKPIAKEINERLVKADKMTSDAFDHRLAAAIRLEDARKMCQKSGVQFKKWVEANVKQSYETVRKLVAVGASDNPKLALEDMRLSTKKRVEKHRAKASSEKVLHNTTESSGPSTGLSRTPWEVADDMIASLGDKEQLSLIQSRAHLIGRKVITAKDAEALRAAIAPGNVSPALKAMKKAFKAMKASDKMKFLNWAAKEVGAIVHSSISNGHDEAPIPEKGGEDIPESMRR